MRTDVSKPTLTVYWDGQCPLCAAVKSHIVGLDKRHQLSFVDLNDPEVALSAAPRFSPNDLAQEMRVHVTDGTWRTGYFAWAAVIGVMPALKWLAALMQSWIFADIGPKTYRWIADHRYAIARSLHLPEPCAPDGSCRIPAR